MKGQATDWNKIITNLTYNKGLASILCKEFSKFNKKITQFLKNGQNI